MKKYIHGLIILLVFFVVSCQNEKYQYTYYLTLLNEKEVVEFDVQLINAGLVSVSLKGKNQDDELKDVVVEFIFYGYGSSLQLQEYTGKINTKDGYQTEVKVKDNNFRFGAIFVTKIEGFILSNNKYEGYFTNKEMELNAQLALKEELDSKLKFNDALKYKTTTQLKVTNLYNEKINIAKEYLYDKENGYYHQLINNEGYYYKESNMDVKSYTIHQDDDEYYGSLTNHYKNTNVSILKSLGFNFNFTTTSKYRKVDDTYYIYTSLANLIKLLNINEGEVNLIKEYFQYETETIIKIDNQDFELQSKLIFDEKMFSYSLKFSQNAEGKLEDKLIYQAEQMINEDMKTYYAEDIIDSIHVFNTNPYYIKLYLEDKYYVIDFIEDQPSTYELIDANTLAVQNLNYIKTNDLELSQKVFKLPEGYYYLKISANTAHRIIKPIIHEIKDDKISLDESKYDYQGEVSFDETVLNPYDYLTINLDIKTNSKYEVVFDEISDYKIVVFKDNKISQTSVINKNQTTYEINLTPGNHLIVIRNLNGNEIKGKLSLLGKAPMDLIDLLDNKQDFLYSNGANIYKLTLVEDSHIKIKITYKDNVKFSSSVKFIQDITNQSFVGISDMYTGELTISLKKGTYFISVETNQLLKLELISLN